MRFIPYNKNLIEIDGEYHNDPEVWVNDQERQKILEDL